MTGNSTRVRSWPAGLLGALVLVAGVEVWVGRHAGRFSLPVVAGWAQARRSASTATRCDVVALGDSLMKHGLAPAVVERRLGRPTCNLAMSGGGAPGFYFQFRRLLHAGARPAALLLDVENLNVDPLAMTRSWPELLSPDEWAGLAWSAGDAAALARMTITAALPTYRMRSEVRGNLLAALAGEPFKPAWELPPVVRNWLHNRNAELLPPRGDPPGVDPRPALLDRDNYRPASWACHPLNALYLTALLDLATAADVRVFWLLPPLHPEVQARRERFGQDGQYVEFVRGLAARYANLTVIDGRRAGYPAEALADMTHLNRSGALAFSDGVAERVGEHLAGVLRTNWVELPRWRAGAVAEIESGVVVEDVQQSARALGAVRR
jgi:hypothetical protein